LTHMEEGSGVTTILMARERPLPLAYLRLKRN
jgi:hypothetical protein